MPLLLLLLALCVNLSSALINFNNVTIQAGTITIDGGTSEAFVSTGSYIISTGGDVNVQQVSSITSTNTLYQGNNVRLHQTPLVTSNNDTFTPGASSTAALFFQPTLSGSTMITPHIGAFKTVRVQNTAITVNPLGSIALASDGDLYLQASSITGAGGSASSGYLNLQDVVMTNIQWTKTASSYSPGSDSGFNVRVTGSNTLQDVSFLQMTGRFRVDSGASLTHQGGVSIFTFNGVDSMGCCNYNLVRLEISGPSLRFGDSAGYWLLTPNTLEFYCDQGSSQPENRTVIRTNSPSHCVDITPTNYNTLQISCNEQTSQNAFNFFPNTNSWEASDYVSNYGPRVCGSSTSLVPVNGPKVINGVSFTSTIKFLLTTTFTYKDLLLIVDRGDFFTFGHGTIVNVNQISFSQVNGVYTHVYEITVEASCDGAQQLHYFGTVGGYRGGSYRFGLEPRTNTLVYAGCLGSQFCL